MDILEASDSTMILGARWRLCRFLFDTRVLIDRAKSEIVVHRRCFGRSTKRSIPIAKVDSVKMSTRLGTNYRYIRGPQGVMRIYDTPRAWFDLWIDATELGRIPLARELGLGTEGSEMESLGRRVAKFMGKPFIDTAKSCPPLRTSRPDPGSHLEMRRSFWGSFYFLLWDSALSTGA